LLLQGSPLVMLVHEKMIPLTMAFGESSQWVKETLVPNKVWTLEQKFGILDVQVPLRMSVVKMSGGGLFVYNAIAATHECLDLMAEIVAEHGPVVLVTRLSVQQVVW
jgi:hypothetical protein